MGFGSLELIAYLYGMRKETTILSVRDVISKKNDLVMRMTFSTDENEVRKLMKEARVLEKEILQITQN